ncbi:MULTISPECIES: amidohydrolase [unclassified Leifsonia]|uniref:amidohydrolase n=1 Tax=unclassified Leifsonia TaxID=2663824 RepID=UPI0006F88D19|nr:MULTISPECIES: amidohydrolase [unclassified Leifsonia]KQX07122.1 amidohydrolase [Leifsonia sp. Root1293]KRA11405.1 amidohydrolase [Leifsonia sp. Root60]
MTLVLAGGRILGSDAAVDIVIDHGAIAAIVAGGSARAHAAGSPDAVGQVEHVEHVEHVDLDGRVVLPGLWDNHVHFTQWALTSRRLDLSAATSAAEVVALVGERIAEGASEVIGFGFRDGLWPEAPTAALLDAVAASVPVVLVSGDLHSAWLDSSALALHGFGGHPTGLLREDDAFAVVRALDDVPEEVLDAWAREAASAAATRGVVGIVDLEMTWNRDVWLRRIAGGLTDLRVEFGVYRQHLDDAVAAGLRTGDLVPGGDGLLEVGPFKIITDGSLNTRTAFCFDPYPGLHGAEALGLLTVSPDELVPLLATARDAGLRPAVHAIGDHANALALDAMEAVGVHGSIEHAQLLTESDVARFAPLGVTASVQPEHAMDDRDVAERYWAGRTERAFMLRSLLDSGATLALGSDAPVAPLDPWVTIAAAVGRTRDGREPWHPEQSITVEEAVAASTRNRVEVGQPADLVIVDADPTTASVEALRAFPVAATILAGRFTHRAL